VAGGALVIPTQGKTLKRAVEVAPKIEDDFLLEGVVEADAERVEDILREECGDNDEGVPRQQVGAVRSEDVIDDQAGDSGGRRGGPVCPGWRSQMWRRTGMDKRGRRPRRGERFSRNRVTMIARS
jgi:hypothetical protein